MAQFYRSKDYYHHNRHHLILGTGTSNYLGELGGGNKVANPAFLDVDFLGTRNAFQLAYQFNQSKNSGFRATVYYGRIMGSDEFTEQTERRYRNLSFTSNIFEFSALYEFFLLRANSKPSYLSSSWATVNKHWDLFMFTGIAGFRHNPKRNGTELQPLGTEGQGLPNGPEPYSLWQMSVPMGIGASLALNTSFSIEASVNYRITFTDYLNDASTYCYDRNELAQARGEDAVVYADPSSGENPGWTAQGAIRGNPETNDTYYSFMLSINYNLVSIYGRSTFKPRF